MDAQNAVEGVPGAPVEHVEGALTSTDGLELYWQGWLLGDAARAVVALVHGFGEHGGRYAGIVESVFAPHGCTVLAVDLRGHGRSPGQRGAIVRWEDYHGDVQALLDEARRRAAGKPLFLFGHSMGGLIVASYLLRRPQEQTGLAGLILSSPMLAVAHLPPLLAAGSRLLNLVAPHMRFSAGVDAAMISRQPEEVARYQNDPLVHGYGTPRTKAASDAAIVWTQAHAGELRLPLFHTYGSGDRLVPPAGSVTFLANAGSAERTVLEIPGGYHELHHDSDRARYFAALGGWLERRLAGMES